MSPDLIQNKPAEPLGLAGFFIALFASRWYNDPIKGEIEGPTRVRFSMLGNANGPTLEVRRRFSLGSLYLFFLSAAVGFACWKAAGDWFVGALALLSFWIVVGLLNQAWDIRQSLRQSDDLTSDERFGLRFAFTWRIILCCLFVVGFVLRLSVLFSPLAFSDDMDYFDFWVYCFEVFDDSSSQGLGDSILLLLIVAALIGSCNSRRFRLWRSAALIVNSICAIAAAVLLLILLEERQIVSYLVHVTVQGVMMALNAPVGPVPDIAVEIMEGATRPRIMSFFGITTAGVVSVLVNGFFCWELSIRWRRGGWPRICVAILLAVGLIVMLVLAARILFIELPCISPLIFTYTAVPPLYKLAAAFIFSAGLATAVAGRWSARPFAYALPVQESWRRESWRYYHERPILLSPLGIILTVSVLMLWDIIYGHPHSHLDYEELAYLLTSTQFFLYLTIFILIGRAIFWRWWNRSKVFAAERPRMAPGLFFSLWPAILAIVVCSAPILSAWHFACFLRAGCFHSCWTW